MTTDADSQNPVAQPAVEPAEPGKPDRVLTGGKAGRVRKTDVIVAKNDLHAEKITQSNRIAAMFLDDAEDRASQRQDLRMDDWRQSMDRFVAFNERPLLKDAGTVSHARMQQIVHERYAVFDARRRHWRRICGTSRRWNRCISWRGREASMRPDDWQWMPLQNSAGLPSAIMQYLEMVTHAAPLMELGKPLERKGGHDAA